MTIDNFVTDQIYAFLNATDQTQDEQMREYAVQYARACEEVNERLTRCKMFLLSGHRTQAIRFAETEPPLKSVFEQLQLGGMVDVWEDTVSSYGWTRFQPLKAEILEMINDAYVKEKETADVLAKYREMCLSRNSLSDRLLMVRHLAVLDPENPTWIEDIEMMETSLMNELEQKGIDAIEQGNMNKLALVVEQHDDQDWNAEVTPSYSRFLANAVPIIYRDFLIPKKVRKYRRALDRNDVKAVTRIKEEIDSMFQIARTYRNDFQVEPKVQESYDYVNSKLQKYHNKNKMKAFQHDLAVLQSMLQGNHSREQIESALNQVGSHNFPIPPMVIAQVDACLESMNNSKVLSNIAITALVILVVGLAVLAFLLWGKLN